MVHVGGPLVASVVVIGIVFSPVTQVLNSLVFPTLLVIFTTFSVVTGVVRFFFVLFVVFFVVIIVAQTKSEFSIGLFQSIHGDIGFFVLFHRLVEKSFISVDFVETFQNIFQLVVVFFLKRKRNVVSPTVKIGFIVNIDAQVASTAWLAIFLFGINVLVTVNWNSVFYGRRGGNQFQIFDRDFQIVIQLVLVRFFNGFPDNFFVLSKSGLRLGIVDHDIFFRDYGSSYCLRVVNVSRSLYYFYSSFFLYNRLSNDIVFGNDSVFSGNKLDLQIFFLDNWLDDGSIDVFISGEIVLSDSVLSFYDFLSHNRL